ncbi:MAG: hypothetical protein AB8C13_08775 [Phycisphaerales bacterium]
MQLRATLVSSVCLASALFASGCMNSSLYSGADYSFAPTAGDGDGVSVGDRQAIIDATRDVLIDYQFEINRVDARRGVVTTAYKSTQGIASPWDSEQGSLNHEMADFVNQHERGVRVLIDDDGQVLVSVVVRRVHRPQWRVETESIRLSTHATVIDSDGNAQPSQFVTPIGLDEQLARRIGERIQSRLVSSSTSGSPTQGG